MTRDHLLTIIQTQPQTQTGQVGEAFIAAAKRPPRKPKKGGY